MLRYSTVIQYRIFSVGRTFHPKLYGSLLFLFEVRIFFYFLFFFKIFLGFLKKKKVIIMLPLYYRTVATFRTVILQLLSRVFFF